MVKARRKQKQMDDNDDGGWKKKYVRNLSMDGSDTMDQILAPSIDEESRQEFSNSSSQDSIIRKVEEEIAAARASVKSSSANGRSLKI